MNYMNGVQKFDLTIVIPVFNGEMFVDNITQQIDSIDQLNVQVIFVDDGSTDNTEYLLNNWCNQCPSRLLIRQENTGAGKARNRALDHILGDYTLFFDVDDTLNVGELHNIITKLNNSPNVDLAICGYHYDNGFTLINLLERDALLFDKFLGNFPCGVFDSEHVMELVMLTNFPWNKIIRTSFVKETGLHFGDSRVNNDILGHWFSIVYSRKIFLSRAVLCTHRVSPTGGNITNQNGKFG